MLLLNFGHPLREEVLEDIRQFIGKPFYSLLEFPVQFDHEESFERQVVALVDQVGLSSREWQTQPLLINPPAHSLIASLLLAELHGRMGYFPAVIRLKPIPNAVPPQFEFAEVINLQEVRERARRDR